MAGKPRRNEKTDSIPMVRCMQKIEVRGHLTETGGNKYCRKPRSEMGYRAVKRVKQKKKYCRIMCVVILLKFVNNLQKNQRLGQKFKNLLCSVQKVLSRKIFQHFLNLNCNDLVPRITKTRKLTSKMEPRSSWGSNGKLHLIRQQLVLCTGNMSPIEKTQHMIQQAQVQTRV